MHSHLHPLPTKSPLMGCISKPHAPPLFPPLHHAAADHPPVSPQRIHGAINTRVKSSRIPDMKHRSVMVASKLGLRTCIALGDIGNCTSEPKTQAATKVMVVLGSRRKLATRSSLTVSLGKMATRKSTLRATTRQVLPPVLEPSQVWPAASSPALRGCWMQPAPQEPSLGPG